MRLAHSYDVANDLAQETFISAFRSIDSYSGTGSFAGWLYRIAYNTFLQYSRSEQTRQRITEGYVEQSEILTGHYVAISPDQIDLEKAMLQLTHQQAAAITLCYSFGCTHGEASKILSMPIGTVKSNVLRGKVRLRELLQGLTHIEGDVNER